MEATVANAAHPTAPGRTDDPPFLNIFDPSFDYDDPSVAAARERSWFAQTPLAPVVLRHVEAWSVLTDRRYDHGGDLMEQLGVTDGPLYDWFTRMLGSLGGDEHKRLRSLVNKGFTPRATETLRPFIRALGEQLADELADAGGSVLDAVPAFTDRMAGLVMCRLLGVPGEDYPLFHQWTNDLGMVFAGSPELVPRVEAALVGMSDYVTDLLARRRADLGDDLISQLITAEEDGDRLTAAELHNLVVLLVFSGQHTTSKQLGRALVAFAQHPDQWDLLAQRPDLMVRMTEEVCRWSPQARATFRFAKREIDYGDLVIPAGGMILISFAAGNRDPIVYEDPERFDITKERGAKQLVFGGGPHYCVGAGAARLEIGEGISALARRFHAPVVAGEIEWTPSMSMIHGPERLPLAFTARAGAEAIR